MTKSFTENEWKEYAQSSKIIFTSCKDCVFFSSPDTCSCDRLQKFKDSSADVFDVSQENTDKTYKVLSGRVCNMFRTDDWSKAMKIQDNSKDNAVEIARKEIRVPCVFIVICPDNKEVREMSDEKQVRSKSKEKISRIIKTMKSMDSAKIKPKEIILLNESWIKPYDFINYLRIQCEENDIKCKWRLEHFSKENFEQEENEKAQDSFIKNVFKTIKTGYCSVFDEGDIVPQNYLINIDKFLNDDLNAFLILKPKEGRSGTFVSSVLFKHFLGNKSNYTLDEFFQQIEKAVEEQKCKHLIQPLDKALIRQG